MFVQAVARHVSGLPRLARDLASWDFGAGYRPAVFTTEPIPGEVGSPLVVIRQVGAVNDDDRSGAAGSALLQLILTGDKTGSDVALRGLAMYLWEQLDRANVEISGQTLGHVLAALPVVGDEPDGYPGYRIDLTVMYAA